MVELLLGRLMQWTQVASTPLGSGVEAGPGSGGVARASLDHRLMAFKPLAWMRGAAGHVGGFSLAGLDWARAVLDA